MSRIRTIKPDYWTDEKTVELSPWARLLFIGLWNFADDEGRMEYSPLRIKMQIFPGDNLDAAELCAELRGVSLISIYTVEGVEYLQVRGWSKHQRIDKRRKSRFPPDPCESLRQLAPTEGKGREWNGMEWKGREGKGNISISEGLIKAAQGVLGLTCDATLYEWVNQNKWPEEWIVELLAMCEKNGVKDAHAMNYCAKVLTDWKKNGRPENDKPGRNAKKASASASTGSEEKPKAGDMLYPVHKDTD